MRKLFLSLAILTFLPMAAQAAGLNYSVDTPISLTGSSPATTLTIAAGSGATSLVVNTNSVVVTVPASTAFTISSPTYQLLYTGQTTGAVINSSCSGTTSSVTVASSNTTAQTLTFTIASYQCNGATVATGGGSSSGGGGGGFYNGGTTTTTSGTSTTTTSTTNNSTSTTTATTTTTTATSTTTGTTNSGTGTAQDTSALIQQLITLIKLADSQGLTLSPELKAIAGIGVSGTGSGGGKHLFQINLQYGMHGEEVQLLQLFLIQKDLGKAATALHAYGANGNFGSLTKAAVIEYQSYKKLSPASGYFGPLTRAAVNAE